MLIAPSTRLIDRNAEIAGLGQIAASEQTAGRAILLARGKINHPLVAPSAGDRCAQVLTILGLEQDEARERLSRLTGPVAAR